VPRFEPMTYESENECATLYTTAPPQTARKSPTAIKQVNVAGCHVLISTSVKILGVTLDQHLTFNYHVHKECKSAQ